MRLRDNGMREGSTLKAEVASTPSGDEGIAKNIPKNKSFLK